MRDPRHILITGASSGLGAALALEYAAAGVRLSLHGRNAERLAHIASQARERGADVSVYVGDVTLKPDMATWIAACDSVAEINLVIANAGISLGTAKGAETADQAQAIFDTNVGGVLNTVLPALSWMTRRRRGQIALISSLAGFRGFAGAPAYCASKAAVRIYGEALRGEMAAHNVQVNVVCPGFVKTPMTDVNPFPMPLLMSAEQAAVIIRCGLTRNTARIAFPWAMYALIRVLTALPQRLMDFIAARMPRK
jgi:short-subunit dehydrogenase